MRNQNKWYYGSEALSNDEHHNKLKGFSSSSIKTILSDSPKHFYKKYILGVKVEEEYTNDAFEIGTIVHEAILEPEKYAVNAVFTKHKQKSVKRSDLPKEELVEVSEDIKKKVTKKKVTENPTIILEDNQYAVNPKLRYVIESAQENINQNEMMRKLLRDGVAEVTGSAHFKGIDYKIRPDCRSGDYIIDVKTVTSLKPFALMSSILTYFYMLQAVFYLKIAKLIDGHKAPTKFLWLFVNKNNGETLVVELTEDMYKFGEIQLNHATRLLRNGLETGIWQSKDQATGTVKLTLPNYANPNDF